MSFSRIYAIYIRQWFLIKGNPIRLINTFLWLLIDILQWGFISRYIGSLGGATFSFITVILGAIILWEFMSRLQQGVMTAFLEDIWSQNFINYFASPLRITEYLTGLVATSIMTTTIGFVSITILAGLLFDYNLLRVGLMLLPFLLILFIFGIAIGVFISSAILRFGPTAEWLGWPVPLLLSIISGVFYPIATLPNFLQTLAFMTPAAYVFESLRQVIGGGSLTLALFYNLLLAGGLALLYLASAYWVFIRVYRRNLKSGNIARFGAEF